ncbi:MAG: hypothetical protein WCL46_10470 [Chlorobium sp.]|jgi:putative flippase GtrA
MPETDDNKKTGRMKRLGLGTSLLAAIILTALSMIYDKTSPESLATVAVLLAMALAAVFNYLYERRKS